MSDFYDSNRRRAAAMPDYPSPSTFDGNQFAGRTDTVPRPDRSQLEYQHVADSYLAGLQTKWDHAEAFRVRRERDRIERETVIAAEKQANADAETAKVAAHQAQIRNDALDALKRRYLASPGMTEADWAREDHDALLRDQARRQALNPEGDSDERRALARRYREIA
jgi:hypothetical protein